MKLSARSRYAARILLELARNKGAAPMSAAALSHHTGVSVQFVEQILKPLKQSGLTLSVRGAAGGHKLAKTPEQITLGEVVRLMEGGIMLTVCCGTKANDCPRRNGCLTRKAWVRVSQSLERELDSITLAGLIYDDQNICPAEDTQIAPEEPRRPAPPAAAARRPRVAPRIRVKGLRR